MLEVITHENADHLAEAPATFIKNPQAPLQDDVIRYHGQYIAVVVADTQQNATAAASLIEVEYDPPRGPPRPARPEGRAHQGPVGRGHRPGATSGRRSSGPPVMIDQTYTTSENTNNPLGLFTTLAAWDGDTLTLHDSNQWPNMIQQVVSAMFGLPSDAGAGADAVRRRRVRRGAALLVAHPARGDGRPARRPPGEAGADPAGDVHRPRPPHRQRQLGQARRHPRRPADRDRAREPHHAPDGRRRVRTVLRRSPRSAYASPNVTTRDQQVRLNIPWTNFMRAPGDAQGNFALESAIDELAWEVGLDPLEMRLLQLRRGRPEDRPPVVEQRAAPVPRGRRAAVRLVAAEPGDRLDARGARADRLRHGRGQLLLVPAAVHGQGDRPQRRLGLRAQRGDRHRDRDVHDHGPARRRAARARRRPGRDAARRHRDARGHRRRRLGPDGRARQRRVRRVRAADPEVRRPGRDRPVLAAGQRAASRTSRSPRAASTARATRRAGSRWPASWPSTASTSWPPTGPRPPTHRRRWG